ncbi:MAG: hypothetical protein QM485_15100 [Flavobacteriaceae bacterium]
MKKLSFVLFFLYALVLSSLKMTAQDISQKEINPKDKEEEEGPILFKFEPDFLISVTERREELQRKKKLLDTMDISARRRRKLLKNLLKTTRFKDPSKVLVTDTSFENLED